MEKKNLIKYIGSPVLALVIVLIYTVAARGESLLIRLSNGFFYAITPFTLIIIFKFFRGASFFNKSKRRSGADSADKPSDDGFSWFYFFMFAACLVLSLVFGYLSVE